MSSSNSTNTNCEVPWPTFGFQTNMDTAYRQKKPDRPKSKKENLLHP
jgi:hypothetical protein